MKNGFKKAMLTMGVAVMLMGIGAVGANAATVEVGDFTIDRSYAYGSYTTKVKAYNGQGGDIVLPTEAEFSGFPVTESVSRNDRFPSSFTVQRHAQRLTM